MIRSGGADRVRRFLLAGCILLAALVVALPVAWWRLRPLPRLEQIRVWADAGRWEQADEAIQLHLERRPRDAAVLMLGARIAGAGGQLERCAELLEQVPSGSPQKLEAMLRQGQAWRDARYGARAERVWREALARSQQQSANAPIVHTIQAELVSLLSLERRATEARDLLWQMYPHHSEQWRLLIALARLEGRGLSPQVALQLLDEVIERDPTDFEARLGRARYLVDASRWQEAKDDAEHCRSQDPQRPQTLEVLLQCYFALHDWDSADQLLANPNFDRTSPTIWRLRALQYKRSGDWENSEACFMESLRLKPTDPVTHYQFAQLLLLREEQERAKQHQDQFQELDTHQKAIEQFLGSVVYTDPQVWKQPSPEQCVELGGHLRILGRCDEARGWLTEALRQRPNFSEAKQALDLLPETQPNQARVRRTD